MNAIIFDLDGTLVESAEIDDELYRRAVTAVLGPVRFRENLEDYEHVSDSGILAQLLVDNELGNIPDPTADIQSCFVGLLQQHIARHGPFSEVPGARAFLKSLGGSGRYCVAIATGGWRPSAILKLESAGFDLADVPLATSDDDRDRSRIMLAALAQLDGEFESVEYFGDGVWDRDACLKLGWQFQAVGRVLNGLESYHSHNTVSRYLD